MRLLILITVLICLFTSQIHAEKKMIESQILATADSRIEKHRKANVVITVVDEHSKPVEGAIVEIEQTRHAFLFGANAFGLRNREGEELKTYKKRFADLLNYATLPFYWGSYEPDKGKTRQDDLRKMAIWCKANGIATKGHPLVWYTVYPKWGPQNPDQAKADQKARIDDIVPAFKDLIDRWDVVNEATKWSSKEHDNGVTRWLQKDGSANAVKQAVDWAHAANPNAILLYNDWHISPEYEKLLEDLVKMKAPFDAVGIQSHMHGGEWPVEKVWNVCQTYSRFGKPLHFTELTVISGDHGWMKPAPWPTTPEGETRQADYVEKLYTTLFSHPAVEAITWWDLDDGQWMQAPAGLVRKDLSPKPAYDRLMGLIKGKWWTKDRLTSDSQGNCKIRGFLGDYTITVKTEGATKTSTFLLKRGENRWKIAF